jgi:hypothetical protein
MSIMRSVLAQKARLYFLSEARSGKGNNFLKTLSVLRHIERSG